MKCWFCGGNLIWGGDHTFEDYCLPGDGIVANLSCFVCVCHVLTYISYPGEE